MNDKLKWLCVVLGSLAILGFFLPWMRMIPEREALDALAMKTRLLAHEQNWVNQWLWMSSPQWQSILLAPAEGASGYQLALAMDASTPDGRIRDAARIHLWGEEAPDGWMYGLFLYPLVGLAGVVLALMPSASRLWLMMIGAVAVGLYVLGRWRLAESHLLDLELSLGPGLWLSLYGCLLLGLAVLLAALLPVGKKKTSRSRSTRNSSRA